MIPHTYPSQVDSDNRTQAIIYYLPSITGLERWKDYIPIKETSLASPELNSFNTNGAILTTTLSSTTGKQAWVDYVPVYRDDAATDAWSISATGYLATKDEISLRALAIIASYGTDAHVYLPGIGVINGLTAGNYLNSAGTTAATVDNPVGLVLDAAGNSIARRNLLTYSEQFDNAAWVKNNTTVSSNSTTAPNGTLTADTILENTSNAQHQWYEQPTVVAGTYTLSIYAKQLSGSTRFLSIYPQGATSAWSVFNITTGIITATGGASFVSSAISSIGDGWYRCSVTFNATAGSLFTTYYLRNNETNPSDSYLGDGTSGAFIWGAMLNVGTLADYQQIVAGAGDWATGVHALQATTANKPILRRGAVNLLTFSEQFDNAAWSKVNYSIVPNEAIAPNGTQTADLLVLANGIAASSASYLARFTVTTVGGTVSLHIKNKDATGSLILQDGSGNGITYNLVTEAFSALGGATNLTVSSSTNGYKRISFKVTTSNPSFFMYQAGFTGDGVKGLYIWGAMLNTGGLADYIPTTTAAASSPSGNYKWQFDGSNDSLALGSVPFQMADDHCVIAGARCSSYATSCAIFGISSTASTVPLLALLAYQTDGTLKASWRNDGGAVVDLITGVIPLNESKVFSIRKISNTKNLRMNGSLVQTDSTALGTAIGVNTANIGYLLRTTAGSYHQGDIYPLVVIKGTVSDADLLTVEKFVGSLSGVTL